MSENEIKAIILQETNLIKSGLRTVMDNQAKLEAQLNQILSKLR